MSAPAVRSSTRRDRNSSSVGHRLIRVGGVPHYYYGGVYYILDAETDEYVVVEDPGDN